MNDVRLTNVAVIKSIIRGMSMSIFNSRKREKILENYLEFNSDKLYRLAFIYVKNKDESLDILQDSIVKAYRNINKLKDIKALEKWINRILINTALDYLRKSSRIVYCDKMFKNIELIEDNNSELIESVDNLPEDLKTVIILKYFHGYTINEVSEILEISVPTVKNRLHKALNFLRKEFKEGSYE